MTQFLTIPGYGGSPSDHWQTWFEQTLANCRRIEQQNWDKPVCSDWIDQIEREVALFDEKELVLITHSLGGIALVHWARKFKREVKGAMIVAPPDVENPYEELGLESFAPIPFEKLPFPTILVASDTDPWATVSRSQYFADCWGSHFVNIGDAGHINVSAGFGRWDEGIGLLKRLL